MITKYVIADEEGYCSAPMPSKKEAFENLRSCYQCDANHEQKTWIVSYDLYEWDGKTNVKDGDHRSELPELGDPINSGSMEIDPTPHSCREAKDHEWSADDSVCGHGGGAIITDHCIHCGLIRERNTWASNPSTGEQGFCSIEYKEADE